mmetsp:Transcript_8076/g.26843  ORF Transcript_8076/g.26843 Transcript_8076/m.26843 type:complete len:250 (+) Transcript_8076:832-1581(+)
MEIKFIITFGSDESQLNIRLVVLLLDLDREVSEHCADAFGDGLEHHLTELLVRGSDEGLRVRVRVRVVRSAQLADPELHSLEEVVLHPRPLLLVLLARRATLLAAAARERLAHAAEHRHDARNVNPIVARNAHEVPAAPLALVDHRMHRMQKGFALSHVHRLCDAARHAHRRWRRVLVAHAVDVDLVPNDINLGDEVKLGLAHEEVLARSLAAKGPRPAVEPHRHGCKSLAARAWRGAYDEDNAICDSR